MIVLGCVKKESGKEKLRIKFLCFSTSERRKEKLVYSMKSEGD